MAKTFILGVGAQRTGSTWLYSQIRKNPQINMGFCKEYHVFDALFTSYFPKYRGLMGGERPPHGERLRKMKKELKRLSFIHNPERYFDYFDRLYDQNNRTEAVGDMTPSYSMLDAEAYQFIHDGLEKRGFQTKVIFIMRDPVERIWSMIHQAAKIRKALKSTQPLHERQFDLSHFTTHGASKRTRYNRTITELEKVFSQQDLFYGFYESLFSAKSYAKLSDYLNIQLKTPDFDTKRNTSLMKAPIRENLAADVAHHYSDTYNFVLQRFGEPMRELWTGYQYLNLP